MGSKDEFLQAVGVFINFIKRKLLFHFFFNGNGRCFLRSFFLSPLIALPRLPGPSTHTRTHTQTLLLAINGQSDVSKEEKEGGERRNT